MIGKYSKFAKQARERYRNIGDDEMAQSYTTMNSTVTAPPMAKKAKFLRDADGNIYLWTPELAMRGDLVAAYDPEKPDEFNDDQAQIQINRELEIARERAEANEVARLEAIKEKEAAEAEQRKSEEIAKANQRNLDIANKQLEEEREAYAKQIAELQAQIDALAKQSAEAKADEVAKEEKPKRKAPAKQAKAGTVDDDLDLEDLDV